MLSKEEVYRKVVEIWRVAVVGKDHEVAHSLEDSLHREVLQAIAEFYSRDSLAGSLAALALRTQEIPFRRDCA